MNSNDSALFEAFKRLDKLCRESLQAEHGVTAYIDAMKAVPFQESELIDDWSQDLRMLKHCRHIRNQLAHDDISPYEVLSDEYDVLFLNEFYDRILDSEDPLAKLRRNRCRRQAQNDSHESRARNHTRSIPLRPMLPTAPVKSGCLTGVIWIVLSALSIPCIVALYL